MEEITRKLNFLLANLQVQRANIQAAHWNLRGCHSFIPMHTYFGELYDCNTAHIDMIAEFIRINGGSPFTTLSRYLRRATIQEVSEMETMEIDTALRKMFNDNTFILSQSKEIFDMTDKQAIDVGDYMATIVADYGKRQWFIKSSLPAKISVEAPAEEEKEEEELQG